MSASPLKLAETVKAMKVGEIKYPCLGGVTG
jgi:hypothetical protein